MTYYKINRGLFFPFTFIVILLAISAGTVTLLAESILFLPLPIFLFGLTFSIDRFEINSKTRKYRYSAVLFGFITLGKWKDLDPKLKYVSILRSTISNQVYGGRTNQYTTNSDIYFEVYLISEDLQKKLLINGYKKYEQAYNQVMEVEKKSMYNYMLYDSLFRKRD